MIRLLTEDRVAEFSAFCDKRLNGAVIFTRMKTYGIYDNEVFFWYSENEDGNINAVFSMLDGIFIVSEDGTADKDEISVFSEVVGASAVTYGNDAYLLRFISSGKNVFAEDVTGENLKDVFSVIFEDDENKDKFFSRWYADASHKIRHGLIHGKCVYADGRCVSVALTSGETDSLAIISSVATLSDYRKKGFGESVVLSLTKSLGKEIYLMTDNERTKLWYEKIGFENIPGKDMF